ncbi:hypothetical protein D9619_003785 [Psilocybe cf. subviscida]|uniref:Uncharacterized protein n=1 Tax=Psilocybe cf. subviscida TaxID=2480587 RepID=A0A8H5AYU3_9AGAR|nr:hypothetical protein D9619_003785 [Psilocybe cf. subviscida]
MRAANSRVYKELQVAWTSAYDAERSAASEPSANKNPGAFVESRCTSDVVQYPRMTTPRGICSHEKYVNRFSSPANANASATNPQLRRPTVAIQARFTQPTSPFLIHVGDAGIQIARMLPCSGA